MVVNCGYLVDVGRFSVSIPYRQVIFSDLNQVHKWTKGSRKTVPSTGRIHMCLWAVFRILGEPFRDDVNRLRYIEYVDWSGNNVGRVNTHKLQ